MREVLLSCFFVFFVAGLASGQNPLPIGKWRSHLPYRTGKFVTQSEDKVYYSTNFSILEMDKEELSLRFLSKVDGLSNVGIDFIRYNPLSDILMVVYKNTVIDLLKPDGEIVTMSQIKNFSNLIGEKRIYDIYIENDSMVYLAANYGVSKINISANEFVFTTFTGIAVESVHLFGGSIYVATGEGVYRAPSSGVNLDDFGNWRLLGPADGFPQDYKAKAFATFNGALHVGVNDTLWRYEDNRLEFVHYENGSTLEFLSHEGVHLLAGFRPGRIVYFHPDGAQGIVIGNCVETPNYAVEDSKGRLWFGNDRVRGGFRMATGVTQFCDIMEFDSPWSEAAWDMDVANGQLWLATGGLDQTLSARFNSDGFASFIDGQWTIYNRQLRDDLKGPNPNTNDDDPVDFVTILAHPSNGKVFVGSYTEGLIEVDGETITQFIEANSSLQRALGDPRVRVSGLALDEDGNLWVSNNSAPEPLSVRQADGNWRSFAMPGCNENQVFDLAVDDQGYKWMVLGSSSAGVLLFDEGELDDPNDDRCRVFTSNNSELATNNVNCLAADLEGNIWVGTSEGIIIFECGGSAFEPECRGSRRIVEVDGFGAFLLETEEVQTIAVDGANRKWVGTKNGIFLLSPNGEEQVARFTENNSPLFDNDVIEIAVDQQSGEVFIGTVTGMLSYQSDAIAGGRTHKSEIEVYPNPVREDYDGPIAIRGLARDATVKITDVTGKLVFETTALGGQAIWNGRDYNGRRVNSGVYLVFSSSNPRFSGFTGKADAAVAKILVLN
ncbi:MAG: hypothetical protein H6556_30820 [Lewinellaceae bacterium]|nr:hypothetical protein [Lewinellaceae bacterium]